MSVIAKISRFFGIGSARLESATGSPASHAGSAATMSTHRTAPTAFTPREPVRIDLDHEDPVLTAELPRERRHREPEDEVSRAEAAIEQATLPSAPKNKQELLAELRRNYAEAVTLIRKVDGHLDAQARRSDRMLDLAQRAPEGVEHLAALREGQSELTELARSMRDLSRDSRLKDETSMERHRAILERQASTLGRIEVLFEESSNVERELGVALGEFRGAIIQMNTSNHRLGGAIDRLDQREQVHAQRIDEIAERGRVLTNALVILCGLGIATAMVAVMAVLYLVTR